ncbi:hypothetical protein ACLMJK_006998 [Lecanora helva]
MRLNIGYGAQLTNLFVHDNDDQPQDVVLGYDQGAQYINDTENEHTCFGVGVGRYAGRVKNGTFTINGQTSHVTENENNKADSLHGGIIGYDQRNWTVISHNETSITFMLDDNGYESHPGRVINYATFSVATTSEGPSLTSRLVSNAIDGSTPSMLTTHPYWNLNAFINPANVDILDHTLYMPYSSRYTEIDNIEVATGVIGTIKDQSNHPSLLDFTSPRSIGDSLQSDVHECGFNCTGIDTSIIID